MSVEQTSPLYSVVILSHNRMEALQRTIASIRTQQFCTYEIIVIDGASSDGTLDYLEKNAGSVLELQNEIDLAQNFTSETVRMAELEINQQHNLIAKT